MPKILYAILASALLVPAVAFAQVPTKAAGGVLVNTAGMTLYTYDRDEKGKSACNGPCATNWPPVMAAADAKATGDYTIVTRDDGSKMWAYKGSPLYLYAKDQKAGDKVGDGVGGIWHVIKQ